MQTEKKMKTGLSLAVVLSVFVVICFVLMSYNSTIEKNVAEEAMERDNDPITAPDFFVNKPIRFYSLNGTLTADQDYAYYPSVIFDHDESYSDYDVEDVSIANVEITNSDISNCYFHNSTIYNCNIEDATFINCTIIGCYIGTNVSFLNCPPGSDPDSGIELSEYFASGFEDNYDDYYNNHQSTVNSAINLENQMKSTLLPDNEIPSEADLLFYVKDKTNSSMMSIYNFDTNATITSTSYSYIDQYKIEYSGIGQIDNKDIDFDVTLKLQKDDGWNFTYSFFEGTIQLNNGQINYNNRIDEIFKVLENNGPDEAYYYNTTRTITGDNSSSYLRSSMIYNSTQIDVEHEVKRYSDDMVNYDIESKNILEKNNGVIIEWEKLSEEYNDTTCNRIIKREINESTYNITFQEGFSNEIYLWSELNTTSEELKTSGLLSNGTVLDPHYERIAKKAYRRWSLRGRKTYGGRIEYWYQLTKKDVKTLDYMIDIGTAFASILGYLVSGGIITAVAVIIFLCWKTIKYFHEDPTDGDIEFRVKIRGTFFTGGCLTLFAYNYDRGDSQSVVWIRYISGGMMRLLWNIL